jgi:hypothetical protein
VSSPLPTAIISERQSTNDSTQDHQNQIIHPKTKQQKKKKINVDYVISLRVENESPKKIQFNLLLYYP